MNDLFDPASAGSVAMSILLVGDRSPLRIVEELCA
jgi:hypothetical protein